MFRSLMAFSLACLLSVAACAPVKPDELPVMKSHLNDEAYLLQEAREGNGGAQLFLGYYYCEHDPAESRGARAVKWWQESAKSSQETSARQSQQALGYFYLSLFTDEMGDELVNYDPAKKHKPAHYCHSGNYSKANAAKAARYLKACSADLMGLFEDCNLALGHLYYTEKNYASAYFWYATLIYEEMSGKGIKYPADYKGPLLAAPHSGEKGAFQDDINNHFRFAHMAAKHLTKKQIAAIDAKIRARFDVRMNKVAPDMPIPKTKPANE